MHETVEDIQKLQTILDQSIEQAGTFLRQSFQMPEHSLTAHQFIHLWQAMQTIALATVTKQGEPRVAPIGALLFRGAFYIPTVATAARTGHITNQPEVSFTYFQGNDLAVIVHGAATILQPNHTDFAAIETLHYEASGQRVQAWGEGVFLQILPRKLYSYARYPIHYS